MHIKSFFDKATSTFSYVVSDPIAKVCVVIDPVLNFELSTGIVTTTSADNIINFIRQEELKLMWVLETHIHADHMTSASYLKHHLGARVGIGAHIIDVLENFVPLFNTGEDTPIDGSQFDHLFKDGESILVGSMKIEVIHTPGHTPDCVSYKIGNAIFVGDTLFMPYVGTARCDFKGGSSKMLYNSIQKLLSYPDDTRLFMCHDYPPAGTEQGWETTVLQQKKHNVMINENISEQEFIERRNQRDKTLAPPTLLLPSLQVNMRAGHFGEKESNGLQYIKIPIK